MFIATTGITEEEETGERGRTKYDENNNSSQKVDEARAKYTCLSKKLIGTFREINWITRASNYIEINQQTNKQ